MEKNRDQLEILNPLNSKKEEKTKVEFKIISHKDFKNLMLSYKQIVVILEALYNFRKDVEKKEISSELAKLNLMYKLNEINEIFEYLETGIKYDFEGALNKCINKHIKKEDDAGMGTFNWLKGSE